MPSLVFRHFKEDPSADEGTRVWVSAMMLPTGPISPTFCQGVSSLEKVITFVWVMILNPYFFKYSICSFHLFFFLGKSTYSLRVGVIVSFFDAPGQTGLSCTCCLLPSPFWCVLVHMVIIGFQARVLQEASCFSRWELVFIHFVSLTLLTGLDPWLMVSLSTNECPQQPFPLAGFSSEFSLAFSSVYLACVFGCGKWNRKHVPYVDDMALLSRTRSCLNRHPIIVREQS